MDRRFERGVKEAIYVQIEKLDILSSIFHVTLWFLTMKIKTSLQVYPYLRTALTQPHPRLPPLSLSVNLNDFSQSLCFAVSSLTHQQLYVLLSPPSLSNVTSLFKTFSPWRIQTNFPQAEEATWMSSEILLPNKKKSPVDMNIYITEAFTVQYVGPFSEAKILNYPMNS